MQEYPELTLATVPNSQQCAKSQESLSQDPFQEPFMVNDKGPTYSNAWNNKLTSPHKHKRVVEVAYPKLEKIVTSLGTYVAKWNEWKI